MLNMFQIISRKLHCIIFIQLFKYKKKIGRADDNNKMKKIVNIKRELWTKPVTLCTRSEFGIEND